MVKSWCDFNLPCRCCCRCLCLWCGPQDDVRLPAVEANAATLVVGLPEMRAFEKRVVHKQIETGRNENFAPPIDPPLRVLIRFAVRVAHVQLAMVVMLVYLFVLSVRVMYGYGYCSLLSALLHDVKSW